MTVAEILSPSDVVVGLRASSKKALLDELSRRAADALGIGPDEICTALTKREELGSTGVGDSIALPHARLDSVRQPFGLLARLRDAVAFEAVDDLPVDLVFLLLLPTTTQGENLNALACVARRLRDPEVSAAMRGARDAPALFALASDASRRRD